MFRVCSITDMRIVPANKFEAGPASGRVTARPMQLEEPRDLDPDAPSDAPHGYEAVAADIVGSFEPARLLRAERKAKYELKTTTHREEQRRYIRDMAKKAQQDFDESFTWEERKLIAARAYWSSAQAHVDATGTHIGALEQSELAAEAAAGVNSRSVQRWMYDYTTP